MIIKKLKEQLSLISGALQLPGSPENILQQLGKDEEEVPYYLNLLNLSFVKNKEKEEVALNKYRELALNLRKHPEEIRKLIISLNWRPTLVGNAVAILLREKAFQEDMIWRLENRSWVAPQLAAGIAILDEGLAEDRLIKILVSASDVSNPKTIMSTYSSLVFLKSPFAEKFEKTAIFERLKEKDNWDNSFDIAEHQYDFWRSVEPL